MIDKVWGFASQFLLVFCIVYFYPEVKNTLFPDRMTRLENMFRRSSMAGYHLAIDRKSVSEINLSVFNGARSITTQIYRDVIHELDPVGDNRVFFTHAVNSNAEGVTYLSRTRIETDSDMKPVRYLEVTVCGRIKDQSGQVGYDGHEPVYECEAPIWEIKCSAKEHTPFK
jgi:hypothetical protein